MCVCMHACVMYVYISIIPGIICERVCCTYMQHVSLYVCYVCYVKNKQNWMGKARVETQNRAFIPQERNAQ